MHWRWRQSIIKHEQLTTIYKIVYLLAARVKEILEFYYITVLKTPHYLQFSVLKRDSNIYSLNSNFQMRKFQMQTLKRLSCSTFLMATSSPLSHSLAWNTTPKLPLPMTLVSEYDTSWGRSGPWPGVATTVVTLEPSLPKQIRAFY